MTGRRPQRDDHTADPLIAEWHAQLAAMLTLADVPIALPEPPTEVTEVIEVIEVIEVTKAAGVIEVAEVIEQPAEVEAARGQPSHRDDLVRALLFGTGSLAETSSQLLAYGLDPACRYVAVRASPTRELRRRDLEAALGFLDSGSDKPGLHVLVDGDVAGFLRAPPRGHTAAPVGVGPARPLESLAVSFRLATHALLCARRSGLHGVFTVEDPG